jgi:hypothetical protein
MAAYAILALGVNVRCSKPRMTAKGRSETESLQNPNELKGHRILSGAAMPRRSRINLAGMPQHIVQRGINREPCFFAERKITGARVGVQPFGGVPLSGTGVQAGGADYLKPFLWSRCVSENTMRDGFIPEK